ncbi:MAG TPA: hypothetical protein VFN55_07770, partial [Solirubrobacteraceae bacterium]|nr:hypothetical protein [Solirubrobacteraceae bacterium]
MGLASGDLRVVVVAAEAAAHPHLGQRDDVQREVELPVAAAGQPVAGVVGASDLDRRDSGVVGERRSGGEPAGAAGAGEQPAGENRADAVDLEQPAAVLGDGRGELSGELLGPLIGSRISVTSSRATCLRVASTGPAGRTRASSRVAAAAVRSVGAPPGSRSRSSACSWLTSRVRWVMTLLRRSSSSASTVVM